MTAIRPISAIYRAPARRTQPEESGQGTVPTARALVPVTKTKTSKMNGFRIAGSSAFETQLLAGPARRGLKANDQERRRNFAAYQTVSKIVAPRQQKWA
ncbi:MAG: hypothetical protein COA47_08440 [Robiginitomaculum sp.]|nr:MAG: hypothetical protein COA47_08440 [Robiginitomaculum sp.]